MFTGFGLPVSSRSWPNRSSTSTPMAPARAIPGRAAGARCSVTDNTNAELYGGLADETTNNRMELTAPAEALESLKRPCGVRLYTDSTYVKNGITSWVPQ